MASAIVTFSLTHDDVENMPGTIPDVTEKITAVAAEHGMKIKPPAVFVVTLHDTADQSTDTMGGFLSLPDARELAAAVAEQYDRARCRVFIEEWRGDTFHAQRELRHVPNTNGVPAHWDWYVSESPNFAPIKEDN